jgi:hypothetical protein
MNEKENSLQSKTGASEEIMISQRPDNKGEMILYQPDSSLKLEVRLEDETVWLNRQQMSVLFGRDPKTIGKHINNALNEELLGIPTVANFATVQKEGNRIVEREIEYYSLDMILSVGYRVKSQRGIQFRIWSNRVLREYMLKGYAIHQRFERIEQRLGDTEKKVDFFIRTSLPPVQGVFCEGEIFDAYIFVSDLIRSAKRSVALIDNYVDGTVLMLLSKRMPDVVADIYTKEISLQLELDMKKHNAQYAPLQIHETKRFHDRFLMVDDTVYHIGASLKDLGKKLFAFSKIETDAHKIINGI